ncbi:Conserved_hypothetical protein [Hexamita inflata]|uniref:Uncharacterized protein n=1 Tax=Hexamita inflata TaxID=28002 RepID=A0ABP1KPY0_9EUKA
MKAIEQLYDQMRSIFGEIYLEIEEINKQQEMFNPNNQRKPLKECVLTLFPSTKDDASLRIFKRPVVQEKQGKSKAQDIIVEISPEYQEHLFRISPSLERCYIDYQKHHQTDFWSHVVCAANEEQRLRQEKLGFSAKDEHKDARNLIKDLYQQIAYKFSPLQKVLSDCLSDREKHRDLLLSYGHSCSYDITKNNNDLSNEVIKINDGKPNLMQKQYIANGVSIPEVSYVNEVQPIVPTQFYGKSPDESQFYTSDEQFHLIRQINSFSMNVLKPLSNNVIPDPHPPQNRNVQTHISASYFNMNVKQQDVKVESLPQKSFKDFKIQTIQERVNMKKIDTLDFRNIFADKNTDDFKYNIKINYTTKSTDDDYKEKFSLFQDFYEQFITFNRCFYSFLRQNNLQSQKISDSSTQSEAVTIQNLSTVQVIKMEQKQQTNVLKKQLQQMKVFMGSFDDHMRRPGKDEKSFLQDYPALYKNASNLSDLFKKCSALLEELE